MFRSVKKQYFKPASPTPNSKIDMSKIILVTGGNSGIGFELVRLLAEKNHIVYLGARGETAGKEAEAKLHSEGFKTVKFILIDVTKAATIESAMSVISAAEGKLDVLVNNAGIGTVDANQNQSALSLGLPFIRGIMETNLLGLIQTTISFIPLLRKSTQGVVLNVSSDLASNTQQTTPNAWPNPYVAYTMSKAAVNAYTIALAHKLEKDGIKVNVVTPGFTSSKLTYFAPGAKPLKEGAESLLPFALLDKDGPTCKFFDENGKELAW